MGRVEPVEQLFVPAAALPVVQLASFLRDARNSRIFEMYYVELAARLRRGELLGPKWEGIDFEHGNLWMKQ